MTNPMFIEDMKIDRIERVARKIDPATNRQYVEAYIIGRGFRRIWPGGRGLGVSIDGGTVRRATHISTGEYLVEFEPPSGNKWKFRIAQPTREGIERDSIDYDSSQTPDYEIARYLVAPRGRTAVVDLVVKFPGETSLTAAVRPEEGTITSPPALEVDNKFRTTIEVKEESLTVGNRPQPVLRDSISVTLIAVGGARKTIDVALPLVPSIRSVEKDSGHFNSEQDVTIRGANLQRVARVFVGSHSAQIVGDPGRDVMIVRVPKGDPVEAGKKNRVPIRLETDIIFKGRKVSNSADFSSVNAYYTYLGDPAPNK